MAGRCSFQLFALFMSFRLRCTFIPQFIRNDLFSLFVTKRLLVSYTMLHWIRLASMKTLLPALFLLITNKRTAKESIRVSCVHLLNYSSLIQADL